MSSKSVLSGAMGIALAMSLVMSADIASAAESPDDGLTKTVEAAVPEGAAAPGAAAEVNDAASGYAAVTPTARIRIPEQTDAPLVVTTTQGEVKGSVAEGVAPPLTIGLPDTSSSSGARAVEDSTAVQYSGDEADTLVQPFDRGLRISTVIHSADASLRYGYALPAEVTPVLSDDGSVDLSARFSDPDDEGQYVTVSQGRIAAAWATDAHGAAVATHYEVASGLLTQVVEPTDSTVFPVVADPTFWWGWNVFISNAVHQRISRALQTGVRVGGIAALFIGYIPNAYVKFAATLAYAALNVGALLWDRCNARGRGVIIGRTWLARGIPPLVGLTWMREGFFCLPQ